MRQAFHHHNRWYDDHARTTFSQLAAALAVLTGAAHEDECATQLQQIAARSLDPDDTHAPDRMVLASPFMHHYLFEALRHHGRAADIIAIIRLRWGRWARAGEPTTWENWNVDFPDGSQCHAFSAHAIYHLAHSVGPARHSHLAGSRPSIYCELRGQRARRSRTWLDG